MSPLRLATRPLLLAFFSATAVAALLLAASAPLPAQAIPERPWSYVTDLPRLLSEPARATLEEKLRKFEQETGNQIFVLIAPDLGGLDEFTATFETASRWGIGQKGKDNGVLIALYLADRKVRIEVGYGLEGSVPDARANQIIRNVMVPRLRDGSPDLALHDAVDELIAAIRGDAEPLKQVTETGSFAAGYIPAWLASLLTFAAVAYVAVSLLHALVGGITVRFDRPSGKFRFQYDILEFLSELIANQIIAAIAAGIPAVALYFILEEFQVAGYPVILIAALLVFFFYLKALFTGTRESRRNVRELTENPGAWRKLAGRFDANSIEQTRLYFRSCLDQWRPAFVFRAACERLEETVRQALKKPESYFAYTAQYSRKQIDRLLHDTAFWEDCRQNYVPEQVRRIHEELERAARDIFKAPAYDTEAASQLLTRLRQLRRDPETILEYTATACAEKIRAVLEDNALWAKWRQRSDYSPARVNRTYEALRTEFAALLPVDESVARRGACNGFYRRRIKPLVADPGALFRRQKSRAPSPATGHYRRNSSFSSSRSPAFSGFGNGAAGGGGSFGGGGSSGSW